MVVEINQDWPICNAVASSKVVCYNSSAGVMISKHCASKDCLVLRR